MHFDFPERICMYQSLSLSLSIYICKNGLDPDQTGMEFRKECFVNLKIWACDRKHAKHQYCRISDFVVQKPMRTRSISKYYFQHRYMIFFEITRDSYASASLSLCNTGPDPLEFSKLPSQHSTLGHHRHAKETPFKGVSLAGR